MKRAWKGLFRKGEANVVKIICLSVGLAIGLVMLAEVIFERSYDNFLPGLKDTYRLEGVCADSRCHRTGVTALLSGGGSGHPFHGNWIDDTDHGRP